MRTDFTNLKSNLNSLDKLVELAQQNVDLKQRDVDRKTTLSPAARLAGRSRHLAVGDW